MASGGPAQRWAWLVQQQFARLDRNDPSAWPALPRALVLALTAAAVIALAWLAHLGDLAASLQAGRAQAAELQQRCREHARQAAPLEALRAQREQAWRQVRQLEAQLPRRAEMAALLSGITQAGRGRGLQFELFRPGQELLGQHHAELPIAIRVHGKYHDLAGFAADIASLPRIVALAELSLAPGARDSGMLTMEASVRAFRHLDEQERARQQAAAASSTGPAMPVLPTSSIPPIDPPREFRPQDYRAAQAPDPFSPQRLAGPPHGRAAAGLPAAPRPRKAQPLEAYPLDSFSMVGYLDKRGSRVALVRHGGLIYQVAEGMHMGQNHGKVIQIAEHALSLRETVQNSLGEWVHREAVLPLQEAR